MNNDQFRQRIELEEIEDHYTSLKKKTADIPFAYEDSQRMINRQKEIWERILQLSKGTDSEKQVYQKLEELEEKQQEFSKVFSIAEEEIQDELVHRKQLFEDAEQAFEEKLKEETDENNV